MTTRRDILAGVVATAALPMHARATTGPSHSPSLAECAAARGLRFGAEAGLAETKDQRFVRLVDREAALIVPGNEFKLYTILPNGPDRLDFTAGDAFVDFARVNHKPVRGHTLAWFRDDATPDWVKHYDFGPRPAVGAEAFLRRYIHEVTTHYGPDITSWDVVNEAVDPFTGQLRDSVFTRLLGQDAVRIAFAAARDSLPSTPLVYNDYMDWRADREPHRQGVLTLLRWLQDQRAPVDVIGLQSHIRTPETPFDPGRWGVFLNGVRALGLDMAVSEFSVSDQAAKGTIDERDRQAAAAAGLYLQQVLAFPEVKEVLAWGLTDKYAWYPPGKGRADGLPVRQALYDDRFQPKPARDAVAEALRV